VLLLERLHAPAGVEHDGGERIGLAPLRRGKGAVDDLVGLSEADRAHDSVPLVAVEWRHCGRRGAALASGGRAGASLSGGRKNPVCLGPTTHSLSSRPRPEAESRDPYSGKLGKDGSRVTCASLRCPGRQRSWRTFSYSIVAGRGVCP